MITNKNADMKKQSLSELFTAAVARHGSQVAVAKKCGITQSMVSLYVGGKVLTVKSRNVHKISRSLGIRPATLVSALGKPFQPRNTLFN